MPEGPEVAIMAEQLRFYLESRVIIGIIFHSGKFVRHGVKEELQDALSHLPLRVTKVTYKGKLIVIKTLSEDGKKIYFFSTLGMSGRWSTTRDKHSHIEIALEPKYPENLNPVNLYYVDPRCFGNFDASITKSSWKKRMNSIEDGFLGEYLITEEKFVANVEKNKRKNVAKSLMDQGCLCSGVGNYLLSEICHLARINPFSTWESYSEKSWIKTFGIIKRLVIQSYDSNGASVESFYDMSGEKGDAHFQFRVYGQETDENGNEVVPLEGPHRRTVWISKVHDWIII